MPDEKKDWKKETWVCIGTRIPLKGGGRGVEFRQINDDATLGREVVYGSKHFRSVRVGAVYEIQTEDSKCHIETLRFLRQHEDKEAALAWMANEEVRKLEDERKRSLSDAKKVNALAELFDRSARLICDRAAVRHSN